jgi:hypothetical protein
MSATGTVNVCILWQHELQVASAALAEFNAKCKDESIPMKEWQALVCQALHASHVALQGADTATHLTVCDAVSATRVPPKQGEATPTTKGNG